MTATPEPQGSSSPQYRLEVTVPPSIADPLRAVLERRGYTATEATRRAIDLMRIVHTGLAEGKAFGALTGSGLTSTMRPLAPFVDAPAEPGWAGVSVFLSVCVSDVAEQVLAEVGAARGTDVQQSALHALSILVMVDEALVAGERLVLACGQGDDLTYQVIRIL